MSEKRIDIAGGKEMGSDYVDYLQRVPLFRGCTPQELTRIASLTERVSFSAGDVAIVEGDRTTDFFLLRSGTASVTRRGIQLATLHAGDHFGELAVLDPAPRNATVTMTSVSEAIRLQQREFWTLLHELPPLRHLLLSSLAHRVHKLDRFTPAPAAR